MSEENSAVDGAVEQAWRDDAVMESARLKVTRSGPLAKAEPHNAPIGRSGRVTDRGCMSGPAPVPRHPSAENIKQVIV